MPKYRQEGHTLAQEREFINSIGTGEYFDWSNTKHNRGITRLELLKCYKSALQKRTAWDGIDSNAVINYLSDVIRKEKRIV